MSEINRDGDARRPWQRAVDVRWRRWWVLFALATVTTLGGLLRLFDLGRAGIGSTFYASAVYSMGRSFHNFVYAAYDPAATLLTDKPPLALWVQVASTKLLGFEGWALILPMALAGTIAIPLVYLGARLSHSVAAGLLAALALAVFPESVATARDSTMDALMMALLATAAVLLLAAVERRSRGLLLTWALVMGLVFNVKYFEGFVVMPAAALYLVVALRHEWRRWVAPVAAAAAVVVVVSLSWVTFVELTPAEDRPIVLNDADNSAYGLIARYNGLDRVLPGDVTIFTTVDPNAEPSQALVTVAQQFGVGDRGVLRLVEASNGPLLGASVVLALAGIGLVLWRRRDWLDGPGLFWVTWCVTGLVLFSVSNRAAAHYHESYAPALAVMIGVGLVEAARLRGGWRSLVLPLLVFASAAVGWWAVREHALLQTEVRGAVGLALLAAVVALVVATPRSWAGRWVWVLPAVLVLTIPLASSLWIAREAPRGGQITRPNPLIYAVEDPPSVGGRSVPVDQLLTRFGSSDGEYQFAIDGVNAAGEAIAYTGVSVLPIYNEYLRTPLLAAQDLDTRLARGDPPFVLTSASRVRSGLLSDVLPIVQRHCAVAPPLARGWILWDCRR